jgi:hypothetical protein
MAAKKSTGGTSASQQGTRKNSDGIPAKAGTPLAKKAYDTEAAAASIPYNENKASEYQAGKA